MHLVKGKTPSTDGLPKRRTVMKITIAIIAASALAGSVYAAQPNDSFVDNYDTEGTILLDVGGHSGVNPVRKPTGHLVPSIASGSNYGSILLDLDRQSGSRTVTTQPAIGDVADDYGSILYETGARY
jgi:hypothetical protein